MLTLLPCCWCAAEQESIALNFGDFGVASTISSLQGTHMATCGPPSCLCTLTRMVAIVVSPTVKHWSPDHGLFLVRTPRESAVMVRAALSFVTTLKRTSVTVRVLQECGALPVACGGACGVWDDCGNQVMAMCRGGARCGGGNEELD